MTMFGLSLPFLFNIIYGSFLYRDLHINRVYYFIRYKSRLKWYIKTVAKLVLIAAFYCFIWIFAAYLLTNFNSKDVYGSVPAKLTILVFLTLFLYVLLTTILVNLVSFFWGTAAAFVAVYGFLIFSFKMSFKFESIRLFGKTIDLTRFNIIDNTILTWKKEPDFSDITVNLTYVILSVFLLGIVVQKTNISLKDKEMY